jgi:hypothetical protein
LTGRRQQLLRKQQLILIDDLRGQDFIDLTCLIILDGDLAKRIDGDFPSDCWTVSSIVIIALPWSGIASVSSVGSLGFGD